MDKPNGGPAFPIGIEIPELHSQPKDYYGMTLRDYFAGQALMGVLANHEAWHSLFQASRANHMDLTSAVSLSVYEYADAMLAERDKGSK